MEVLSMQIFQLRLEELDEEQLMVVYQAAMEQQPARRNDATRRYSDGPSSHGRLWWKN